MLLKQAVKTITIQVTEEEHKQAKITAFKEGKTLKRIFLDAIQRLAAAQKQRDDKE